METALQKATDRITLLRYDLKHAASLIDIESANAIISAYDTVIGILRSFHLTEKEQIEDAYHEGFYDRDKEGGRLAFNNDYYTQTYQSK